MALAGCVTIERARVAPDARFEQRGYSFGSPAGTWYEVPAGTPFGVALTQKAQVQQASRDRVRARSAVFEAGGDPGPEGLWKSFRSAAQELNEPETFTVRYERFHPVSGPAQDCIWVDVGFLRDGETELRTLGKACRHPRHPDVAVALLGTVRQDDQARRTESELQAFFDSLTFTDERPIAFTSAPIGFAGVRALVSVSFDAVWAATPSLVIALDRRHATKRRVVDLYPPNLLDVAAVFAGHGGSTGGGSPLIDHISAVEMGGSLWVMHQGSTFVASKVFRIDPPPGSRVRSFRVWDARAVAASADAVFLASHDGLHRFTAASAEPELLHEGAYSAAVIVRDTLWIVEEGRPALIAFDPATGAKRGEEIALPSRPAKLVASDDVLFALVDGARPEVLRVDVPARVLTARFPLPSVALGACVRRGALWISLPAEGVLRALDAKSGNGLDELPLRSYSGLLCDGDAIWTTVQLDTAIEPVRIVP